MAQGGTRFETRKRGHLDAVQAARGVAALLVALYHGGRMLSLPQYVGRVPLGNLFAFGHAGVDFFFVLSGFIMMHVHHNDLGSPRRLAHYAWRRLARIVPMYWVVLAAVVLMALPFPEKAQQLTLDHLAASLLLVPDGREPLLGVSWTLQHEMLFYAAFGLAVLRRPLGLALTALSTALVVAGPWLPPGAGSDYVSCSYHLQFLLGIVAAIVVQRGPVPAPRLVALAGTAAFLATGLAENAGLLVRAGYASQGCFGVASAVALLGLVDAERRGGLRIGRPFVLLGAASYSIYLCHTVAMGLTAHGLASSRAMVLLPGWAAMALTVGVSLAAGLVVYSTVERSLAALTQRVELAARNRPAAKALSVLDTLPAA